ncbi:hypothetical protein OROGR_029792 [Orobanche gracilis]
MASSQTSTQAQKEMIIDGRIFARPVLIERTNNENEDVDLMEFVVSKVKQQGIYRLVSSHSEVFDKKIIEEFYLNAAVSLFSLNLGGGVHEISSSVNSVEICLNQALLEKLYKLPSDGLKFEELEGYGTPEFLAAYWSFFVGDKNNKPTHPDDWMLAFDRSAEGRALYRDREDDSFTNWWRGTKNDPSWKKH